MQLLLINPNTNSAMTHKISVHLDQIARGQLQIISTTASFGSAYISTEASYAVATHATLDAWTQYANNNNDTNHSKQDQNVQCTLIACFGDPGLFALREVSTAPVTGLAEASFIEATQYGEFAVVTGGKAWGPMLKRLALSLGYNTNLIAIHTVDASGAQLAADPIAALELLANACRTVLAQHPAKAIILGGAGLVGMAQQIQPQFEVPIIDSVSAGARWALATLQKNT